MFPFSTWRTLSVVPSVSLALLTALGIVTHQAFRKYETYAISVHLSLLIAPPTLLALYDARTASQVPSLDTLLIYIAIHLTAISASVLVYRLTPLHPLWRYPGPFWCRATNFWHASVTVTGKQHLYLQALHERYGNVVRIGPNALSIRDASLVNPLMGTSGLGKGPNFIGAMLTVENVPMAGIMDTEEHLRRRRAWNRGLGQTALREYDHLITKRAKQLATTLAERADAGEEVVLGRWFNAYSYDFMCDMAFGGGSEIMRDGDRSNVWHVIEEGVVPASFLAQVPWLGIYVSYIPFALKSLNAFLKHGQTFALRRMERGSVARDLFHYLNNEDLPDKQTPPLQQLVDDGILAIVAGADTVASALTSILYCVLTHTETFRKLRAEVDHYYPMGEDPLNPRHYREMTYLQAVIHEALRLFPPIMTSSPRMVSPNSAGTTVGSLYLPPGTSLLLPPWSLHHDPHNFTEPDSFWPERWLIASGQARLEDVPPPPRPCVPPLSGDTPNCDAADRLGAKTSPSGSTEHAHATFVHNETAFLAFSHGPMGCVGKGLGLQEMRAVLVALVQQFDFRLREGWDPRTYPAAYQDYFIATRPEVPVVLERRC